MRTTSSESSERKLLENNKCKVTAVWLTLLEDEMVKFCCWWCYKLKEISTMEKSNHISALEQIENGIILRYFWWKQKLNFWLIDPSSSSHYVCFNYLPKNMFLFALLTFDSCMLNIRTFFTCFCSLQSNNILISWVFFINFPVPINRRIFCVKQHSLNSNSSLESLEQNSAGLCEKLRCCKEEELRTNRQSRLSNIKISNNDRLNLFFRILEQLAKTTTNIPNKHP